jgi:hypothetical protein
VNVNATTRRRAILVTTLTVATHMIVRRRRATLVTLPRATPTTVHPHAIHTTVPAVSARGMRRALCCHRIFTAAACRECGECRTCTSLNVDMNQNEPGLIEPAQEVLQKREV